MTEALYDLIIIGGGPAGLTAGIYAGRAKRKTLLFAGSPPGGQLVIAGDVDDFPGFPDGVQGSDLIQKITEQAKKFETEIKEENVAAVDLHHHPFLVKTNEKSEYRAKAIIIATGAAARWLGLENEQRLVGHGISACAVCDGFFFKGKVVAVVGGGDSALEDAIYLTKYAQKVYVIHRRDQLRAAKQFQDEAFKNPKIEFIFDSIVTEIKGEDKLEGVTIKNKKTGETKYLPLGGLFMAIGHKPATDIFKGQLDLDEKGFIEVKERTRTSQEGVFAAGDVADPYYKQAVVAAGRGAMAALDADKWLRDHS